MSPLSTIQIDLSSIREGLRVCIDCRMPNTLFDVGGDTEEDSEARYQIVEGCLYDYELSDSDYILGDIGENIVQQHRRLSHIGTIAPNIFVGTLQIPLLEKFTEIEKGYIQLEVRSVKSDYRSDYRDMLELITEKCTDLLLQTDSPASQTFDIDYTKNSQTLYQRFAFVKSVINTDEFEEAIHRIVTNPVTKWTETNKTRDIRNVKRFSNANIKEICKVGDKTKLPEAHYLRNHGISSLPKRIAGIHKTDSVDTPENRFIKHALETFLKFCTDINHKTKEFGHSKTTTESEHLIRQLENHLHHSIFKEISNPSTLKLNSPVLQRKEGYREILRVWLMFDLAAKLIWIGGENVYSGGKKDVATLYEYWLFFKLLDLFQNLFDLDAKDLSDLIKPTSDGLSLQIKQGKHTALQGVFDAGSRKLNIRFNYNRSFEGKKKYPDSGSWTTSMRPDYTLSLWPQGISEQAAEEQELIVHIHFDAKYKIANLTNFIDQSFGNDLNEEKAENKKGIYKNGDLLKMHAYKDAIRRTGGAYVLYPGNEMIQTQGFHEIIPGLGAFPIRPSKTDSGVGELKTFILAIIHHFLNRASQREKMAFRTYDVYKTAPDDNSIVNEALPETYNSNRDLIPDDTFVLIGYYKSQDHYDWMIKHNLYNFRASSVAGSLVLDKETVSAKYLLLHTDRDDNSSRLWKISGKGPKIFSKADLIKKGYPKPSNDHYLVINIEQINDPEFANTKWNFKNLRNYSSGRQSALPFTASLTELMKNKV